MSASGPNERSTSSAVLSAKLDTQLNALLAPSSRQDYWRGALIAIVSIAGCAFWYCTLSSTGVAVETIPWYLCITAMGTGTAARACRRFVTSSTSLSSNIAIGGREPMSLLETWSLVYLITAAALFAITVFHHLSEPRKTAMPTQIVDIQLVSGSDFANRNSPMPGTQQQAQMHKRDSAKISRQGSLTAEKVAAIAQRSKSEAEHNSVSKPAEVPARRITRTAKAPSHTVPAEQAPVGIKPSMSKDLRADDMILIRPQSSAAPQTVTNKHASAGKAQTDQPYMQEVQPPELVEMVENDGVQNSQAVFQAGGRSEGGSGAANDLSKYLQELHKRIKALWSPPRGQAHKAKLLFRIRKDGKLSFIKVTMASGDGATDEAAMKSVIGAVGRQALPDSANIPYLDVEYTFNYNLDELKEIRKAIVIQAPQ